MLGRLEMVTWSDESSFTIFSTEVANTLPWMLDPYSEGIWWLCDDVGWGGFNCHGLGPLAPLEVRVMANQYNSVLIGRLFPVAKHLVYTVGSVRTTKPQSNHIWDVYEKVRTWGPHRQQVSTQVTNMSIALSTTKIKPPNERISF